MKRLKPSQHVGETIREIYSKRLKGNNKEIIMNSRN